MRASMSTASTRAPACTNARTMALPSMAAVLLLGFSSGLPLFTLLDFAGH